MQNQNIQKNKEGKGETGDVSILKISKNTQFRINYSMSVEMFTVL